MFKDDVSPPSEVKLRIRIPYCWELDMIAHGIVTDTKDNSIISLRDEDPNSIHMMME